MAAAGFDDSSRQVRAYLTVWIAEPVEHDADDVLYRIEERLTETLTACIEALDVKRNLTSIYDPDRNAVEHYLQSLPSFAEEIWAKAAEIIDSTCYCKL